MTTPAGSHHSAPPASHHHPTTRRHGRAVLATAAAAALLASTSLSAALASPTPAGVSPTPAGVSGIAAGGGGSSNGIAAGFPDASTSGVPAGTTLEQVPGQVTSGPGWAWNSSGGYLEVSGNGADLAGLSVNGNIDISASNVTLNDVRLTAGGSGSFGVTLRHTSDVTIENSTITGVNTTNNRLMVGIKDVYGDATGTVVDNDNIAKTSTGVQIYQGTIENNYIHTTGMITGDHINGITTNGDNDPLLIQHNTILNSFGQTDAIGLFQDFSTVTNVTINDNFLAGGGYTIYGGMGSYGPTSGIVITNNTISTMYYPQGGYYGPVTAFDSSGTGNTWSGNTYSTGQTIPEP